MVPVVIFTLVYNVPKFLELSIQYVPILDANATVTSSTNDTVSDNDNATATTANYDDFDWTNYTGPYQVQLKPTELRLNRTYIRVYILWMNLILQILGPFLVLIVLNVRVYKRIIEFEQTLMSGDQLRVCFTRMPSTTTTASANSASITSASMARNGGRRFGSSMRQQGER